MGFILTYWNLNMQLMLYFNFRIMDTKEIVKTKEVQSKSLEKVGAVSGYYYTYCQGQAAKEDTDRKC